MEGTVFMKKYYSQLDGVRALAIFLVAASHTSAVKMTGQGGLSVAAFFALSGFLFVLPWTEHEEDRFLSVKGIGTFYLKRALRLLPTFYVVIILTCWLTNTLDRLPGELTFSDSGEHLWFLQQELLMYLIAPFLLVIVCFLKKKCRLNNLCIGILLFILAFLLQKYLTSKVFYLMGNGKKQSFRLGLFVLGMAFGYFYKFKTPVLKYKGGKLLADFACLILVAASVFSAAYFIELIRPDLVNYYVGWKNPFACALGSSLLYFLLLINPDGLVSRIFRNPAAVFVGQLSYGIYLVHFFLIPYVDLPTCKQNLVAVFLLSLGASLLLKETIEKPVCSFFVKHFHL